MNATANGAIGRVRDLVDVRNGEISREIFMSEQIHQMEIENLFPRAWLFVGHATQVPSPGDFFSSWMGSDRSSSPGTTRASCTCC